MTKAARNVHVLFVHGVGQHSRLSALLRAYQAFRSNLKSAEAPTTGEDPIPDWRLDGFSDDATTPYLKLAPKPGQPRRPEAVYFYEVNYSALAGVIRDNQRLDITRLFVGLDLAVNVARARLRKEPPEKPAPDTFAPDHAVLARYVQRLTGVFVAATVPILGLPSLLLRNYTQTFVATFTRFFDDVATFALDKNGEKLISAHVDRTIANIVGKGRFTGDDDDRDELVIVAHSLGTIVVHNYLLRHWSEKDDETLVPARLLTYGSPIGFVCWLWLFLDYPGLRFNQEQETGRNYFCWDPQPGTASPQRDIQWINVINHLDPIASAYPSDYIDLTRTPAGELAGLVGGRVEHRYIKTGGMFSVTGAHTAYIADRKEFLEIVGRLTQLRRGGGDAPEPGTALTADAHWRNTIRDLLRLRALLWAAGIVLIGLYLWVIAYKYDEPGTIVLLLPFYAFPPATIALLAFFQRLMFGGPSKRTDMQRVKALPWLDLASFPYRLRRIFGFGCRDADPMAPRPKMIWRWLALFMSFVPTALAMWLPIGVAQELASEGPGLLDLLKEHSFVATAMVAVFFLYLVCCALSEFVAHWRMVVVELTKGRYPERRPSIGVTSWPIYVALLWSWFMLSAWGVARAGVCWGDYGWIGAIFCHAQWGTFAALLAALVAFWFLLRDLHDARAEGSTGPVAATLGGYWSLKGAAFAHATVSTLLLVLCLIGFGWLVFFSPIRF